MKETACTVCAVCSENDAIKIFHQHISRFETQRNSPLQTDETSTRTVERNEKREAIYLKRVKSCVLLGRLDAARIAAGVRRVSR